MNNASPFAISIIRASENDKSTTGELFVNGEFLCHTLELPYKNNQSYISSIPSGTYSALVRYDKKDNWRLQLENVPDRTGIQIHLGNYPSDIIGCVLVGHKIINKDNTIQESSAAYAALRTKFYGTTDPNSSPDLQVTVTISYNIGRTEFKDQGEDHKFLYAKQSYWEEIYPNQSANPWAEGHRDLKYIYLKSTGAPVELRIPLHGGKPESRWGGGDWKYKDYPYVRSN
jgi:hypothetical protein